MAEGQMFVEKRKFKRKEKLFFINYKLMPKDNDLEALRKEGQSQDISIGGVRIAGEPVGEIGDIIRIDFRIETKEEPIVTFAEVKWIRDTDEGKQFGVEFMALKKDDEAAIEKVIDAE